MRYHDHCTFDQARFFHDLDIIPFHHTYVFAGETAKEAKDSVHFTDGYNWFEVPGYKDYRVVIPAYTSAELSVMLPPLCSTWKDRKNTYHSVERVMGSEVVICSAKTEAESRAKLLIHLIKEKRTTVSEINQRLIELK